MKSIPSGAKTALLTLSWFPVLYTFTNHGFQPCQISGFSMSPTFNPGKDNDIVMVQKFGLKKPDSFKRGDIVMFKSPNDPHKLLTKRVVGLQGETVLPRSPPYPRSQATIPRNHLWVEGDNTTHSIDSNEFGPISQALVIGKVITIVWPPSRYGTDITKGGRDPRKPYLNQELQVKELDT